MFAFTLESPQLIWLSFTSYPTFIWCFMFHESFTWTINDSQEVKSWRCTFAFMDKTHDGERNTALTALEKSHIYPLKSACFYWIWKMSAGRQKPIFQCLVHVRKCIKWWKKCVRKERNCEEELLILGCCGRQELLLLLLFVISGNSVNFDFVNGEQGRAEGKPRQSIYLVL